eukprot:2017031-Rhodomonas_salina.2
MMMPGTEPACCTTSEEEEAQGFWSGAVLPWGAIVTCTLLDALLRAQEGYYLVVEQVQPPTRALRPARY